MSKVLFPAIPSFALAVVAATGLGQQANGSENAAPTVFADASGKFRTQAEIVGYDSRSVRLRKLSGDEVDVPLKRLNSDSLANVVAYAARDAWSAPQHPSARVSLAPAATPRGAAAIGATIIAVTPELIRVRKADDGEQTIALTSLDRDSLMRVIQFCDQSGAAISPDDHSAHVSQMLRGVTDLPVPGIPGLLAVVGRSAFPVLTIHDPKEQKLSNVLVAARFDAGRVAAYSHNGFIDSTDPATIRLLRNVIRWTSGQEELSTERVKVGWRSYANPLAKSEFAFESLSDNNWERLLSTAKVVVTATHDLSDEKLDRLRAFVRRGGGLVTAEAGWVWQSYVAGPGQRLPNSPGNRLLNPAGIVFCSGSSSVPESERITVSSPPALAHAGGAIMQLKASLTSADSQELETIAQVVGMALQSLPDDSRFAARMFAELPPALISRDAFIPTATQPLKREQARQRALIRLQSALVASAPPKSVAAYPGARFFPGTVRKSAPRKTVAISVDPSVPRWHSTGLYAPPGAVISLQVPDAAVGNGLSVRIGAHTDKLWHKDQWLRFPEISIERPLAKATTEIASAFGGLIYVVVPDHCDLSPMDVKIHGAVAAPHYVLGETDPVEWRVKVRGSASPWAELQGQNLILTVPTDYARTVAFPEPLLEYWDMVLDACADLRTISRDRRSPERIVVDQQISAGYLHAGYPIMGPLSVTPNLLDLARLKTEGDWGFYHEIGHNHQSSDWTWPEMGEVTVNLFSAYCFDMLNPNAAVKHPAIKDKAVAERIQKFKRDGDTRDPFLKLIPYLQLQQAFGWDLYKKVFAEYESLPDSERPKNDQEKRDQWLVRVSRATGKNLGPFYQFWKVPTSQQARDQVSELPVWMPAVIQ